MLLTARGAASSAGRTLLSNSKHYIPRCRQNIPVVTRPYSTMLQGCVLKDAFLKNEAASMGVWQTLPGQNVSRILARAGVDWVMVDCEHGNMDGTSSYPLKYRKQPRFSQAVPYRAVVKYTNNSFRCRDARGRSGYRQLWS